MSRKPVQNASLETSNPFEALSNEEATASAPRQSAAQPSGTANGPASEASIAKGGQKKGRTPSTIKVTPPQQQRQQQQQTGERVQQQKQQQLVQEQAVQGKENRQELLNERAANPAPNGALKVPKAVAAPAASVKQQSTTSRQAPPVQQQQPVQAKGPVHEGGGRKKQHTRQQLQGRKRRAVFWAAVGALTALGMAWVLQQENVRLGVTQERFNLGVVNVSLPVPTVELTTLANDLTELQNQLYTKLATFYAAVNMGNTSLSSMSLMPSSTVLSDWLPSMDSLTLNMSLQDALDKIKVQIPGFSSDTNTTQDTMRPGQVLASQGHKPKHPVVIIPGFVTSQLELWQGEPCATRYFRQRMWGTLTMMQTFLRNTTCWFHHMGLDPVTGLDPPGVKLRAAQGLEAVDFFVQGYWVFGKLVQALADVGYDTNNVATMAYDWRLAVPLMEARDAWFTRTKFTLETLKSVTGQKSVLVSHSYGEGVARAFLLWAEGHHKGWVEEHVHAHVEIAGPTLGVPKALTALLSGEMRDTAQLGALASFLTDRMMPRTSRARLFRSWASVLAMMPVGGTKVWGNTSWAPDDDEALRAANRSNGAFLVSAPLRTAKHRSHKPSEHEPNDSHSNSNSDSNSGSGSGNSHGDSHSSHSGKEDHKKEHAAAKTRDKLAREIDRATDDGMGDKPHHHKGGDDEEGGLGVLESIRSWFTASDEKSAGDLLDLNQVHQMDVNTATALALRVAGPLMTKHYLEWASVHGPKDITPPRGAHSQHQINSIVKELTEVSAMSPQHAATSGRSEKEHRQYLPLLPNPLTTPLPPAPSMRIYCMYGVGIPTERSYHYVQPDGWHPDHLHQPPEPPPKLDPNSGWSDTTHGLEGEERGVEGGSAADSQLYPPPNVEGTYEWRINTALDDPDTALDSGIQMGTGDLTVPLISLGGLCRGGWKGKRLNPAGMKVVTREYKDETVSLLKDPRGGPKAASHVDILGNEEMLMDILKVATGADDQVEDRVLSRIDDIVAQIPWEDEEGWDWEPLWEGEDKQEPRSKKSNKSDKQAAV